MYMIMCPPISLCPEPPKDQSTCIKAQCPTCGEPMWFSEKKRTLVANQPNQYAALCTICCVRIQKGMGHKREDIEVVDINKSGGIQ